MRRIFILVLTFLLLASCEEEIDHPIAEYTWPVVHCLLNFEDTVHYVRLGKTFSGPNVDDMMSNPDSLYFREANVYFDILEGNYTKETIKLEVCDDLERDPGVFPSTPFRLYKTDHKLNPGIIKLRIEIPEYNRYVMATIGVRDKPHFSSPDPELKKVLDFYEQVVVSIVWDGFQHCCETTLRLWYLEFSENGVDTCKLDWVRYNCSFVLEPNDWFDFMLYWIKDDYRVSARRILSVDILASGGNGAWDSYLTGKDVVFDLISDPWSNVTGAYGFVSSRASGGIYGYMPDREFLDSLTNLPRLERLKFVSRGI